MGKTKKNKINNLTIKELNNVYNKLKNVLNTEITENMLKNNIIEFEYNKVNYRIKRPTFKQRQEAYEKQVEKRLELLQNSKYMLEDDLKKLYKEKRNIDIDDIIKQINILENQKNNYQLKLGEALKNKVPENEKKVYKEEIKKIEDKQNLLSIKKTNLLEFSIENQTLIFVYSYLTYLITEKKDGNKWIKAWKTYDNFLNTDDNIINTISWYSGIILRNELVQI